MSIPPHVHSGKGRVWPFSKLTKKHQHNNSHTSFTQTVVNQPGKPVWTERSYMQLSDEAYRKNVIAYRAIGLISQAAASVKFELYEVNDTEQKTKQHHHPLMQLLQSPNPRMARGEFFEALYAYRMIAGNAYMLATGAQNEPPKELYTLRPDRVQVVAGTHGMPMAYDYTVDASTRRYDVDTLTGHSRILHLKQFNPLSDWYGMSPIEAAAYSIDQHNEAAKWNQALLQHGAKPSGALMVKNEQGGKLEDSQYNRLKEQMESEFSGSENAGRPLLLEGGLEWVEMSLSPKDMDFIESKHSSARDIALAFGVPPQLLGIPGDNTYSNLAEARLALWEQSILPLLHNVVGELNAWLVPQFGNHLVLEFDENSISALAPRREAVWNRVRQADFLTVNEKRQAVGLAAISGGDVIKE